MSAYQEPRSAKRTRFEASPASTSPRKRVKRHSETPNVNVTGTTTGSNGKRNKQQTLTQIDFVRSNISFEDDASPDLDLTELEALPQEDSNVNTTSVSHRRASTPRMPNRRTSSTRRRRSLKKRDSTLTQMDFFRGDQDDDNGMAFDDTMIDAKIEKKRVGTIPVPISAFDGSADAPSLLVKTRSARSSVKRKPRVASANTPIKEDKSLERNRYQTRKRRKTTHVYSEATERHQESQKIMPAPEIDDQRPRRKRDILDQSKASNGNDSPVVPVLEIQETKFTSSSPSNAHMLTANPPRTPTKPRNRIPSSQTPESIIPSTKTKGSRRKPLADMSTNIRMSPFKSTSALSPKRKVCVLKMPPREHLRHSSKIDDSQRDIWSIQPTSSVSAKKNSSDMSAIAESHEILETPSKPSTPVKLQNSSEVTTDILPSARALMMDNITLPAARPIFKDMQSLTAKIASKRGVTYTGTQLPQESSEEPQSVNNRKVPSKFLPYDQDPVNMIPEYSEITTEELSDLGSPVPNETQFVRDLLDRISSPIPNLHKSPPIQSHVPPSRSINSSTSLPISSFRKTPIPKPRLVHTSPYRTIQDQEEDHGPSSSNTKPAKDDSRPSLQQGSSSVRITRVPLNDTNSYIEWKQTSSSSPLLPPQPRLDMMTQKSIYPASMPHPSQISTQVPSQLTVPTSSAPKSGGGVLQDSEIERITVKDSSSVPARLSQFRRYADDGNGNGNEIVEIGDSEQDDDELDFDLDPASFRQDRTVRKWTRGMRDVIQTQDLDSMSAPDHGDEIEDDVTQTPTQKVHSRNALLQRRPTTQSSPVIVNATTKSQRDAMLEVISLKSSSPVAVAPTTAVKKKKIQEGTTPYATQPRQSSSPSPIARERRNDKATERAARQGPQSQSQSQQRPARDSLMSSPSSSSIASSPSPRPLKRRYSPIPGFDNETQSNFTQNGHVTAAYVHRQREDGLLPDWFVPKPFKPPNWEPGLGRATSKKRNKDGKLRIRIG